MMLAPPQFLAILRHLYYSFFFYVLQEKLTFFSPKYGILPYSHAQQTKNHPSQD